MADPTQSASGARRPPKRGDSAGDDWRWDDIEWFEETPPAGFEVRLRNGAGRETKDRLDYSRQGCRESVFTARQANLR